MKNLTFYHKDQKRRASSNRFQIAISKAIDETCLPIIIQSNARWDNMQQELKLQRCKLNESISKHPLAKTYDHYMMFKKMAQFIQPI